MTLSPLRDTIRTMTTFQIGDIVRSKVIASTFLITNKTTTKFSINYTLLNFSDGREHIIENTLGYDRVLLKFEKVS